MNKFMGKRTGVVALIGTLALAGAMGGCQSTNTRTDRTDAAQDDKPTTQRSGSIWGGTYRPDLGDGDVMTEMAFPTGDKRTSALLVHQVSPAEVMRGAAFPFSYHVTNLTDGTLSNVTLSLDSKSNLAIERSTPGGTSSGDAVVWSLGEFGPKETKVIRLTGSAERVGTASDCISVSYNNFLCSTVQVVEPALALTKTATQRTLKCDAITLRYTIRNTGTGLATDARITDTLPEGLAMENGSRSVSIPVGDLAAGESKTYEVTANASRTGTFSSPASASAGGGLEADARATETLVIAPALRLSSECRDDQFLGRNMTYSYTLENTGDGEAAGATASVTIPSGTRLVSASSGGRTQGSRVVWDFSTLAPGAERDFSITVLADAAGEYESTATAGAACADAVERACTTEVRGIPAVLLEVIDETDPVEVGDQTVYVIRVTNQGSAPDSDVRIVADLPDEQTFVSATGTTSATPRGQRVTFAPVRTLGVGAVAEWRITVRANAGGDVRFRVEMNTEELSSPVNETEATNLYE